MSLSENEIVFLEILLLLDNFRHHAKLHYNVSVVVFIQYKYC